MPSILSSHFSDELPLTNGSLSLEGSSTFPKDADNGVLPKIFVKTADIADIVSQD
jgi:hypothetical protein